MILKKRSFSRLIAIQALYQYDFFSTKKSLDEIKNEIIDYYLGKNQNKKISKLSNIVDINFLENLLNGIWINLEKIDNIIKNIKTNVEITKVDLMLKQILRLGTLELVFIKNIPKNVTINEYVNITSQFYEKNVTNFINGVLEYIYQTKAISC
ncbi:transcription antitermination factor NusB [Pseudomonadota bacterium]